MLKIITEDMIEQAAIKALHERHNYTVLNCMTEEPDTLPDGTGRKDKKQVVLPDVMLESLCRINPNIPEQTVRTVVDELCHTPVSGDLMLTNYQNYQKIRNGITVEYNKDGKKTSNILRLLSYNDALSNTFTVASQMWISGETHWRRPDLIIFINGFPLVFIELKNSNIPVKNAYDINELFIVGWQNDPQPKERVKGEIVYILNKFLPESYDRVVFLRKSTLVFDHIVDQAMTGYNWVA